MLSWSLNNCFSTHIIGYGAGIDWAGKIIERLTGKSLHDLMAEGIWSPLGLKNVTFFLDKNPSMKPKLAGMSARSPKTGKVVPYTDPFLNDGVKDAMGGQGLFADLTDYIKILQSLLRNDEKLLSKPTVDSMFRGQMTRESHIALNEFLKTELATAFVGDFPLDIQYDWGFGGILVQQDNQGRRSKGTMIWSGMPNLFWVS